MNVEITDTGTELKYPYLAYYSFSKEKLTDVQINGLKESEIYVIGHKNEEDEIWVQKLDGMEEGYYCNTEKYYQALPKGFEIKIKQ